MKIGDICPMTTAKVKFDNAEFGYKVSKRGDRLIFAYLGLLRKDDDPFNVEESIRGLGWVRPQDFTVNGKLKDGVPCDHKGCLNHVTHPCEGCGRVGGRSKSNEQVALEIIEKWEKTCSDEDYCRSKAKLQCMIIEQLEAKDDNQ